jgi:dihydrodipicolinate synthase/N-acetylneuraminate lyase
MVEPRTVRYRGVFPVVPTTFTESGALDLESQKRCVDFMIDAGSNGLCILANFSEQFVLSDAERELLTSTLLDHVRGRVPVIVTTTHFSTQVCAARSLRAQEQGASMVMVMPPYHGATIRVGEGPVYEFFARLSDAIHIPIMIQDAPVAGTPWDPAIGSFCTPSSSTSILRFFGSLGADPLGQLRHFTRFRAATAPNCG